MSEKANIFMYHNNPNSFGSVVTRIAETLRVSKANFNNILICPGDGPFTEKCRPHCQQIIKHKFTENNCSFSYIKAFLKFTFLLIRFKPKLIILADYTGWKPAELLAAKIFNCPTIIFIDFFHSEIQLQGFLRWAKVIIANSHATAEVFFNSPLKDRTIVLHNAILPELYAAVNKTTINSPIKIGYIGALHPIKGIEVLISALSQVKAKKINFELLIAGQEKVSGYQATLIQLIDQAELAEQIKFIGHVNNQNDFFEKIDFLVVPSLGEPFGYVNIEAGAAGLTVVASNTGGIPEIIIDQKTGLLFETGNADSLADKITTLLENPNLILSLGQAARTHVEKNFNLNIRLADWKKILLDVGNKLV